MAQPWAWRDVPKAPGSGGGRWGLGEPWGRKGLRAGAVTRHSVPGGFRAEGRLTAGSALAAQEGRGHPAALVPAWTSPPSPALLGGGRRAELCAWWGGMGGDQAPPPPSRRSHGSSSSGACQPGDRGRFVAGSVCAVGPLGTRGGGCGQGLGPCGEDAGGAGEQESRGPCFLGQVPAWRFGLLASISKYVKWAQTLASSGLLHRDPPVACLQPAAGVAPQQPRSVPYGPRRTRGVDT